MKSCVPLVLVPGVPHTGKIIKDFLFLCCIFVVPRVM